MSMRIHKLTTYLRPENAHSIVEFLEQVRDMLLETYGDDIRSMLQEASQRDPIPTQWDDDDEPF